jgi:RNA polymerase sigma-70 factor, ECF subfamily
MHPRPEALPAPEIDDVTLARAQRGEGAAFEHLVRRYRDLVWSYLWRMIGAAASRSLVEDLFQETFLGVHRGLGKFSTAGPARLSTWILSIATRVALYRRRTVLRERPAADPDLERSDGGAGAQGIERRAMVTALVAALAALSPEHRSIVVLREFHGLEYEEIASALGLEAGTVRSRLHRARESLRHALEQGERPARARGVRGGRRARAFGAGSRARRRPPASRPR